MADNLLLTNKVAIVTGSSSGIGEAIALLFARRGAKVTICGRNEQRLKSVLDKAVEVSGGHEGKFITVQGDVNDSSVRSEIVSQTIQKFARLDILVANAGIVAPKCEITDATEESYDYIMNTNVKSTFFLIQQALPYLEESKGTIINISSMVSTLVSFPGVIYPMSKAALDHLSRCLALALGPKGIRVNTVNPSFVQTRIRRTFGGNVEERAAKWAEQEIENQPLDGRAGKPEDVAETVAFLASEAAGFLTGQNIFVDGGRRLGGPFLQAKTVE